MMSVETTVTRTTFVLLSLVPLLSSSGYSNAADIFFEKKTITLVVASAAGGGYDQQARLMSRYLGRHIPGNPQIVVQNIPGAGGLVAANSLYNLAPRDGTVMSLLQRSALTAKILLSENINFDVSKFSWVGSLAAEPGVLMVWHTSSIATPQDLFNHSLIVGGAGVANDTELTPKVINRLIGTRLQVVPGYQSATAIALAMERGEVDGIADWSWSNAKALRANYLTDHLAHIVMQFGLTRLDELANVPTPLEFAGSEADRRLLAVYLSPKAVSRPVGLPPDVPITRVSMIRAAFLEMNNDPDFISDARKSGIPIDLADHKAIENVIDIVSRTPSNEADRLRAIINGL